MTSKLLELPDQLLLRVGSFLEPEDKSYAAVYLARDVFISSKKYLCDYNADESQVLIEVNEERRTNYYENITGRILNDGYLQFLLPENSRCSHLHLSLKQPFKELKILRRFEFIRFVLHRSLEALVCHVTSEGRVHLYSSLYECAKAVSG